MQQTKLEKFDINNLPQILSVVKPLWTPSTDNDTFNSFNVEYIIRNNIWENNYGFQLIDTTDGTFLSAAFFARKNDICNVNNWFTKESPRFSENLRTIYSNSKAYLDMMDERTFSLMNDDDIKLSLFVSTKKGAG